MLMIMICLPKEIVLIASMQSASIDRENLKVGNTTGKIGTRLMRNSEASLFGEQKGGERPNDLLLLLIQADKDDNLSPKERLLFNLTQHV